MKMEVERLLMEIIESRKDCAEIGRSCTYGDDLLGMLLSEIKMTARNKSACSPSMQVIMDECKTFFFAGNDTVALLLTWTIMLLATNRSWQDKVRDEVTRVCDGENPSVHHLPKLSLVSTKGTYFISNMVIFLFVIGANQYEHHSQTKLN